jgi:hypothetical protein
MLTIEDITKKITGEKGINKDKCDPDNKDQDKKDVFAF